MTLITAPKHELANFENISEKTKAYIINAKAASTRKAYRSDWHDFTRWCDLNGLASLPATPHTIVAYLVERAQTLKVSSLDRRLVSIRQAHSMAGLPFDKGSSLIVETMKGIRNTHGAPQTAKAPILLEDLQGMVKQLGDNLQGKRDRALLLLGFTGAFRRSELVGLQVNDMKVTKEGIEVFLRKSKTDQTSKGCVLPIPYGSNPDTCPVRSVIAWLDTAGIEDGAVFRGINRHGHISAKGISSASVALIIKRNKHLEGKEYQFSGHSLRAGFVTTAAQRGVPEHAIMRQSRHKKSDTVKKYIRIANMWQDSAVTKLGL
jgi:site-specific recombinase XerD